MLTGFLLHSRLLSTCWLKAWMAGSRIECRAYIAACPRAPQTLVLSNSVERAAQSMQGAEGRRTVQPARCHLCHTVGWNAPPRRNRVQAACNSLHSHCQATTCCIALKPRHLASSHAPWLRSARHASWPAPQRVQSAPARLVRDKAIQKQICSVTRKTIWTCTTMCALRAPELLRMQPK